jgi:hypothetical protein
MKRPRLISCGTQTHPVKIIPLDRVKKPKNFEKTVVIPPSMTRIAPVNGFDPVPAHLFKAKHANLAARIKNENMMSAASSS